MECSEYSYYISEYLDNRLNLVMNQKIEEHLKKCQQCSKLYNDLLQMKEFFKIKRYERPNSEYFEHLKSNIRRRIISHDVVSWREAVAVFFTQPSWALTAVVAVFLMVSVSFNVMFLLKPLNPSNHTSLLADNQTDNNQTKTEYGNNAYYNTAQGSSYSNNLGNLVQPVVQRGDSHGNSFLIRPVSVRNMNPSRQIKIYQ